MNNGYNILETTNANDISNNLLDRSDKIKLFPADFYRKIPWVDFRLFCHNYARYGIPTIELIEFLSTLIDGRESETIEIGAGAGDLGHHLGIRMTDSKLQLKPEVSFTYLVTGQPTINYPKDVEEIEALEAVKKYKPKVVIGSWITTYSPIQKPYGSNPFGIKEKQILDLVETFIIIGNLAIHGDKPLRNFEHELVQKDWIISRSKDQTKNCILIWNKK